MFDKDRTESLFFDVNVEGCHSVSMDSQAKISLDYVIGSGPYNHTIPS